MSENFKAGSWLVLCDRCGFQRKAPDEVLETWDHLIVCHPRIKQGCWEPRHEQEFVRAKPDQQQVRYSRPEPTETYVSVSVIGVGVGIQETTIPAGTFNNRIV